MRRMGLMAAGMMMTALTGIAGCAGMQDRMDGSGKMGAARESSGSMDMSPGMQMSDADKRMMVSCMAMTHEKMMANQRCAEMAKMHPEMHKRMNNPM